MNIVYVTCCDNGLYGLRYMVRHGVRFARVISLSPDLAEKYQVAGYADVTPFCAEHQIPVEYAADYRVTVEHLCDSPDLLIVNGWNRLISEDVIRACRNGGLGVHAGHPPIGHGRAPIPWNIIKGFEDIEVYVFRLTPDADDGDITGVVAVEITTQDTARLLYEKVMYAAGRLFLSTVRAMESGSLKPIPQRMEYAEFYPKRTPDDGVIDFTKPAFDVCNFVRALGDPYPPAFSFIAGKRAEFTRVVPFDAHCLRDRQRVPGLVVEALPSGLVIQTGSSTVWFTAGSIDRRPLAEHTLTELETYVGRQFDADPKSPGH